MSRARAGTGAPVHAVGNRLDQVFHRDPTTSYKEDAQGNKGDHAYARRNEDRDER
ncbi:MAG TPA: hypothetical protein VFL77_12310 [Solirubrobacterales bacterium]|nr:hypothetical protein [Solirubrobacterales bacterium]